MQPDASAIGKRVCEARKRQALTQQELATHSGVSLSWVKKIEQGTAEGIRLPTVHQLAVALGVSTTALMSEPDAPVASPDMSAMWDATRQALAGGIGPASGEPTIDGVRGSLMDATDAFLASRYADLSRTLPLLLRDADALASATGGSARARALAVRSQARALTAHALCMTWQFDAADEAAVAAMREAADELATVAAVDARCFALLRQGRLAETASLAARWADATEPARVSRATQDELAAWGHMLVWVSTAAVRDNRPDDARDALRLARMAAHGVGRDHVSPSVPWSVFGPATVAMVTAEHAMITGSPDATLRVGRQVTGRGFPVPRNFHRHRLDVAHALAVTRKHDEAVAVMAQIRSVAPEWLAQQRYAADVLSVVVTRRRALSDEMRDLAGFLHLPL